MIYVGYYNHITHILKEIRAESGWMQICNVHSEEPKLCFRCIGRLENLYKTRVIYSHLRKQT